MAGDLTATPFQGFGQKTPDGINNLTRFSCFNFCKSSKVINKIEKHGSLGMAFVLLRLSHLIRLKAMLIIFIILPVCRNTVISST